MVFHSNCKDNRSEVNEVRLIVSVARERWRVRNKVIVPVTSTKETGLVAKMTFRLLIEVKSSSVFLWANFHFNLKDKLF